MAGSKTMQGWAAVVLGVLVALSQYLAWGSLMYLWALLVLVLGVWVLVEK